MDNGTVGSAFDHAAESWDNDVVECDMVKTIVRGHAACHVRGVVMPLKKALVIEIKCLVSGVGGNLRWEDYAEAVARFHHPPYEAQSLRLQRQAEPVRTES